MKLNKFYVTTATAFTFTLAFINPAHAAELESVKAGTGTVKFNAQLQAWTVYDSTDVGPNAAATNFRLRRAELKFSGNVAPEARWFVMIDPTKKLTSGAVAQTNDNKVLQDLGMAYAPLAGTDFEVIVGQFKTPTASENFDMPSQLFFPERALLSRTYGEKREPGLMLSYKTALYHARLMASNGQATNVDDNNSDKDLTGRVDVMPVEGLTTGAFVNAANWGKYQTQRGRAGLNARYKLNDWWFSGEYATGRDAGLMSHGFYLATAYSFTEKLQLSARYQLFNPNSRSDTVASARSEELCLGYYLNPNRSKIMFSWAAVQHMNGTSGGVPVSGVPANGSNVWGTGMGSVLTLAFSYEI